MPPHVPTLRPPQGLAPRHLALALCTAGAACAAPAPREPVQPVAASAAPLARPATFYDIRGEIAPLDESAALPPALGLADLRATALPEGERELRVWQGAVIGYPHDGLVLRVRGDRVTGQLVRYWPVNDTAFAHEPEPGEDALDAEALYAYHEAGRCGPPRCGPEALACVVRLRRAPDWGALLTELEGANAWALPDERELPRRSMVIDGWRMRVEARRGGAYRAYQYSNPNRLPLPEGRSATRIAQLVDSLMVHYARPADAFRPFRGHYAFGADTSDFVACGGTPAVYMGGALRPVAALVGDSAWQKRQGPTRRFYVEGWGTLSPERRQRRGARTYSRSWAVDTLTVARAASPADCRP